jgi:hypothetical protein
MLHLFRLLMERAEIFPLWHEVRVAPHGLGGRKQGTFSHDRPMYDHIGVKRSACRGTPGVARATGERPVLTPSGRYSLNRRQPVAHE